MEQCNHGGVKAWCPVCKSMPKLKSKNNYKTTKMEKQEVIDRLFDLGALADKAISEDRIDEMKNRASMLMDRFIKQIVATPEQADMTKDLLHDIISWEKDLSEYESLETILRERYVITKRL